MTSISIPWTESIPTRPTEVILESIFAEFSSDGILFKSASEGTCDLKNFHRKVPSRFEKAIENDISSINANSHLRALKRVKVRSNISCQNSSNSHTKKYCCPILSNGQDGSGKFMMFFISKVYGDENVLQKKINSRGRLSEVTVHCN